MGTTIANNFLWNLHVRDGEKSLLKTLTMKNNALSRLSHVADFRTRKKVAEGLIMSTVTYAIQVYGGCSGYLLDTLQVQQNLAAKYTTRLPNMTPTKVLLAQCGWLSIRQLIVFHSLVLLHRTIRTKSPEYMFKKVKLVDRISRTSDDLTLVDTWRYKTVTASKGFFPRCISDWNKDMFEIKLVSTI